MSKPQKNSRYQVAALTQNDLAVPWFCKAPREYKPKLALLQKGMGAQYALFSNWVAKILTNVDEDRQIQRIMPKNERVMAYYIRIKIAEKISNYVLILGADVSTKHKSMAYGVGKDAYDYQNCYYIIGSQEFLNEEKFGKPLGERQVRERFFHEYGPNRTETNELVLRLMKIVMAKEGIHYDEPKQ